MAGSRKEVYNLLTLAYGIGLYGKGVLLSRNVRNKMHAQFFFQLNVTKCLTYLKVNHLAQVARSMVNTNQC